MTTIRLSPDYLEMWMKQNRAEYTGDFLEGCLLDNFMVWTKRGAAAVYEYPLNSWSSEYRIEFEPGDAENVWRRWYDFEARYNAEFESA